MIETALDSPIVGNALDSLDQATDLLNELDHGVATGRPQYTELTAAFAVNDFLIVSSIEHMQLRLLDVLNDTLSDFLTLPSATVHSRDGREIGRVVDAIIPKTHLRLATVLGERHEAPGKRRDRHRVKKQRPAFVLSDRFAIQGRMHLIGTGHPLFTIQNELTDFFAIDDARVCGLFGNEPATNVQVAIVRTSDVALFELGDA